MGDQRWALWMLDASLWSIGKKLNVKVLYWIHQPIKNIKLLSYMVEFGCIKVAQLSILGYFCVQLFNGRSVESFYWAGLSKREHKGKRNYIGCLKSDCREQKGDLAL